MTGIDDRARAPTKTHQLITDSIYSPEQIRAFGEAFDGAWARIAPDVGTRPKSIEAARLKLAETVLRLANGGVIDPEKLKEAALESMFAVPLTL